MKFQNDSHTRPVALKGRSSIRAAAKERHAWRDRLPSWVRALASGRSRGTAILEFALVLPTLLALVTGIFAFGITFNNQLTLTSAVGAGAQQLQLIRTTTTDPCADTLSAIQSAAPGLRGTGINLSITMNGVTATGSSCSGDQSDLIAGQPVTVSATYPCALAIYGRAFSSVCQLSANVTEFEY